MFLLRYKGIRTKVDIKGVGEVSIVPEQLIKLENQKLVVAFQEAVSVRRKRKSDSTWPKGSEDGPGSFSVVSRPALPGEKATYVAKRCKGKESEDLEDQTEPDSDLEPDDTDDVDDEEDDDE